VRRTRLATFALLATLVGTVVGTTDAHAQTPPAPPAPVAKTAAETAALQQRRDQLNAALADLDARSAAAGDRRNQADADVARVEEDTAANHREQDEVRQARALPLEARQEFILALYMRGDPRGQQYLDSIATGQFTLEPMRKIVLLDSAEEAAVRRLKELDDQEAQLKTEDVALQQEHATHITERDAADRDLADLRNQRSGLETELAQVAQALSRAQANANGDPLTGLPATQHRPALAVKIDNHPDARPQAGLNQADIVYEELVEGGLTRFIAIFHSTDADPVGPVRSGRTSDLAILSNLNRPLFGSSGGNAGVLADLNDANLSSVIENRAPSAYYRDNSRDAPHNLYTSTGALYAANPGDAGEPPHLFRFLGTGEAPHGGDAVSGLTVRVGDEGTSWSWTGNAWQRSSGGGVDNDDRGAPLRFTNVVVQFTTYGVSSADAASPEAQPIGGGDAWVLTGGRLITGTWSRPAQDDVTVFADGSGQEIGLTPGRTWIALARPGRASTG
jgi:hypothetical protein